MQGPALAAGLTARPMAGQFLFAAMLLLLAVGRASAVQAESARTAYITNQPGNSVSVVDLDSGAVAATIAVTGNPAGVALSPDRSRVYVTAPEAKDLVVIDTASRSVIKRLRVGEGPLGIAVHPNDGRILVADWYQHRLFIVDPEKLEVTGSVAVGQSPSGVAVTPDGATILTADRDSDQVSLIDAATLKVTGTVKTGGRPFGVTVAADGRRAYTANVKTDDVTVIDLAARKAVSDIKVGHRPYAVALAGGRIFVTNQYAGSVSVIEAATLAPVKTIATGGYPEGIEADSGGRHVYVACWDANTLERIDVDTLEVTARIAVGDGPRAFGRFLAPDRASGAAQPTDRSRGQP